MKVAEIETEDLVFVHEAEKATGIPRNVIRTWASRGKIRRFPGNGRLAGNGHEYRTMYALPEILERAAHYRPTPQRGGGLMAAPHCATCRDSGHVCENHPDRPWGGLCCTVGAEGRRMCGHGACACGAGEPCPACCPPISLDGTASITDAFRSRP